MALSKLSTSSIGTTGPKISSWTSEDFCFTSFMTVGSRNQPFVGAEGFCPPRTILSPSSFAFSMKLTLVSLSSLLTIGPRSVSESNGFPILRSFATRTNAETNLSLIFSSTYILSDQMQVWPQFQNRAHMRHFTAQAIPAQSQTMKD